MKYLINFIVGLILCSFVVAFNAQDKNMSKETLECLERNITNGN